VCAACKRRRAVDMFSWVKRGVRRRPQCKPCHAIYTREWYWKNHQKCIARTKVRNKAMTVTLRALLRVTKDVPCADCCKKYPSWVMQFDHVRGVKRSNVGELVRYGSVRVLQHEIAKCEVVCANCHAERTHRRRG
jgi:hypothetical protein